MKNRSTPPSPLFGPDPKQSAGHHTAAEASPWSNRNPAPRSTCVAWPGPHPSRAGYRLCSKRPRKKPACSSQHRRIGNPPPAPRLRAPLPKPHPVFSATPAASRAKSSSCAPVHRGTMATGTAEAAAVPGSAVAPAAESAAAAGCARLVMDNARKSASRPRSRSSRKANRKKPARMRQPHAPILARSARSA